MKNTNTNTATYLFFKTSIVSRVSHNTRTTVRAVKVDDLASLSLNSERGTWHFVENGKKMEVFEAQSFFLENVTAAKMVSVLRNFDSLLQRKMNAAPTTTPEKQVFDEVFGSAKHSVTSDENGSYAVPEGF